MSSFCMGLIQRSQREAKVDHVNIVFADSALVFYPWNDGSYSPRTLGIGAKYTMPLALSWQ